MIDVSFHKQYQKGQVGVEIDLNICLKNLVRVSFREKNSISRDEISRFGQSPMVFDEIREHQAVSINKEQIIAFALGNSFVPYFCCSEALIRLIDVSNWKWIRIVDPGINLSLMGCIGAVIRNDDREIRVGLDRQRVQAEFKCIGSVVRCDDDRDRSVGALQ